MFLVSLYTVPCCGMEWTSGCCGRTWRLLTMRNSGSIKQHWFVPQSVLFVHGTLVFWRIQLHLLIS